MASEKANKKLIRLLGQHKVNESKLKNKLLLIEKMEQSKCDDDYLDDYYHKTYDEIDIPYNNSKISDPVADITEKRDRARQDIDKQIKEQKRKLAPLEMEVLQVRNALNCLSQVELEIITLKYIEELSWGRIEYEFLNKQIEDRITKEGLRKKSNRAMEKLYEVLESYCFQSNYWKK